MLLFKDMTLNDQLLEFRADLHKYFTEREGKPLNLSSLYVEQINKRFVDGTDRERILFLVFSF